MPLIPPHQQTLAEAVSHLDYCNPFLPDRIAYERQALGSDFLEVDASWNVRIESGGMHPNIERLKARSLALARECRAQLMSGLTITQRERDLYEDVVLFALYHQFAPELHAAVMTGLGEARPQRIGFWPRFSEELEYYLRPAASEIDPAHMLGCFFQLRRAFVNIFHHIIGSSAPAVRLRAAVWQSMFTHDMRRYRRVLYDRMGDLTTLITGPSGTGKELVARAIGLSRYIPFDASTQKFKEQFASSFHPINLSALSPTLIESELFGHRRGAFTGALQDRAGWLEVCPPLGTVFLDEVGEIGPEIQVKLLRVLQARTFQRLGDTETREFRGKIIAATNRELAGEMRARRFREDFYYRLCSDIIRTPSLQERLQDAPDELMNLLIFILRRMIGEAETLAVAQEVHDWISKNLGIVYAWPGNVRELEQCVWNVVIRRRYEPPRESCLSDAERLASEFGAGALSADALLTRYCRLVYSQTGNYVETARRLGVDRRTVKARVQAAKATPQETP